MANDQYGATPGSTLPAQGVGYGAPGLFSASYGAAGFGNATSRESQASALQAGSLFGSGAVGAMGTAASWGGTAFGAAQMLAAPLMMKSGNAQAAKFGSFLFNADPFVWVMNAGTKGFQAGRAASAFMGMEALAGGVGTAAVGVGVGLAAATVTAAPVMAAWYAASSAGEAFVQGGRNFTAAQQMLAGGIAGQRLGASANIQQASGLSSDMSASARELRTDTDQVAQIGQFLDSQKYFQSSRDVTEFRAKFKQALTAIKQISKDLQVSLDEATSTFAEIRQQGFYSTSDIRGQASRMSAVSAATGRSVAEVSQAASYGSQMARDRGMHGRFGANMMMGIQAAVDSGLTNKTINEESVMELGGPEAVAGRLAQRSMNFLQSARGRMMIANAIDSNGNLDPSRVGRVMGGMSLEGMVDGAVGRGIGTLYKAGQASTQQQFLQFAPFMMANQAMAQQGMTGVGLMTNLMNVGLGGSREEVRTNLQAMMSQAQAIKATDAKEQLAGQRAQYDAWALKNSRVEAITSNFYTGVVRPMEEYGSQFQGQVSRWTERQSRWFSGYTEQTIGGQSDESRRRGFAMLLREDAHPPELEESRGYTPLSEGLAGNPTRQADLREKYGRYLTSGNFVEKDRSGYVSAGQVKGRDVYLPKDVNARVADARRHVFGYGQGPQNVSAEDLLVAEGGYGAGNNNALLGHLRENYASARSEYGSESGTNERLLMDQAEAGNQNSMSDDLRGYTMAREAERLRPGSGYAGSFRDYREKQTPEEKDRFNSNTARVFGKIKGATGVLRTLQEAAARREAETGGGDFSDVEGLRKEYVSKVTGQQGWLGGGGGFLSRIGEGNGDLPGYNNASLEDSLTNDSTTRDLFGSMMSAIAKGDEGAADVTRYRQALIDHAPGLETSIKNVSKSARDHLDETKAAYGYGGYMTQASLRLNAGEELKPLREHVSAAVERHRGDGTLGTYAKQLTDMSTAGSTGEFLAGMNQLVADMAKGGMDSDEVGILYDATGGKSGVFGLADYINKSVRGDADARRAALKGLVNADGSRMSENEVQATMQRVGRAKTEEEKSGIMMAEINKRGGLSVEMFKDDGSATSVAGMRVIELQRQKDFVQTVDAFLTKFKHSPLLMQNLAVQDGEAEPGH